MFYNYIFCILYIYKLNRIKNILLYNLLINLNTRVKECDIKMKYDVLRLCDIYIKTSISFFVNINCL